MRELKREDACRLLSPVIQVCRVFILPVIHEACRAAMKHFERINVECYSGYKANERPTAFTHLDRRWEIEEIVDRWYEGGEDPRRPAVDYFKVRTCEGMVVILRYLALFDSWSILTDDRANRRDPA